MHIFVILGEKMTNHSTKNWHKITTLFAKMFFIIILANICYSNSSNTMANENSFVDGKIAEWKIGIQKIESIRSVIKSYICNSKGKCKKKYSDAYNELLKTANWFNGVKDSESRECFKKYGSDSDCPDLHKPMQILSDLINTIEGKQDESGNITSDGNRTLIKYLDELTNHQKKMKKELHRRERQK